MINDLAVINCPRALLFQPEVIEWRRPDDVMFVASSCVRQLWVASASELSDFPLPLQKPEPEYKGKQPVLYRGKDAYEFLLSLVCGLESDNRPGETNIAGQFYNSWTKFILDSPDKYKKLDFVVQSLEADSGIARKRYVDFIKPLRKSTAAVRLSGLQPGEHALVVGRVSKDGTMAPTTQDLASELCNPANRKVSLLTVTNPDPQIADELFLALVQLQQDGRINKDTAFSIADFSKLNEAFQTHHRTFVDYPMGINPAADQQIITAWKSQDRKYQSIVNIFSTAEFEGQSSPLWREAHLSSFHGPEAIQSTLTEMQTVNQTSRIEAEAFIRYCAECRAEGCAPNKKLVATGEWKNLPASTPV